MWCPDLPVTDNICRVDLDAMPAYASSLQAVVIPQRWADHQTNRQANLSKLTRFVGRLSTLMCTARVTWGTGFACKKGRTCTWHWCAPCAQHAMSQYCSGDSCSSLRHACCWPCMLTWNLLAPSTHWCTAFQPINQLRNAACKRGYARDVMLF